jgi:ABC-2 type transport system permease protein
VSGAALVGGGVQAAGAFLVAMQVVLGAVTFAAIGALAAQLFDSRRRAATWAGIALALSLMLRVAADGTRTLGWIRWTTPLGWIENVRPFGGTNLVALIPLSVSIVAAVTGALVLRARRDQGAGALGLEEAAARRTRLLTGPEGLALLSGRTAAVTWTLAVGAFAFVFGLLAKGVSEFIEEGEGFEEILRRFGGSGILSAAGFLGLIYSAFIVIVLVVYAGTQISAMREEEATGRLDNVLVHPVGRARWLATRGMVAVVGAVVVAVVASLAMWAGAAAAGSSVSLWGQVRAALNCLPVVALFLGIGLLAFGFVPRLTAAITFGLVTVAYLIQLIGAIVDAPDWVLDLSPFHHVAAVPIVPANVGAALAMLAAALIAIVAGTAAWLRRDIALA